MARQRKGRVVVWLAVIVSLAIAAWIVTRGNESTAPEPQPTAEPEVASEPDAPGEPFEASGTLLPVAGAPSLPINLWDHPDRSSGVVRVVGQLSRGQSVTITRRYRHLDEDQFYYRVVSGELVGWVPETLVDVGR